MSSQRSENIRCIALCGAVKLYLDRVGSPDGARSPAGPLPGRRHGRGGGVRASRARGGGVRASRARGGGVRGGRARGGGVRASRARGGGAGVSCATWEHVRVRALRTPDERFADLPGFGWEPGYADVGGLRMAYVEDGPPGGEPVLLLHGEPSWSFLYRTVMRVLVDAGLRVIAADMIGFGRSDKPAEMSDHSYARHVEWMRALAFDALGLSGVTLVGQDWGGLIGLRLVAEHPDRFARVVAANTGLPTGDQAMPEVWLRFRDVVAA